MARYSTRLLAALLANGTLAAPALAQPGPGPDRWDWSGVGPRDDRAYALHGRGVSMLFPELRNTRRGQAFVMRNFDMNRDGLVSPREADAANRAFARIAGPDRGHFDWDARDRVAEAPLAPPPYAIGRPVPWNRGAMHDYHFRDTPEGARMTLQEDVLFQTDSALMRPHAIDKLQSLAGYLRDNPGVRVSIDGFTDSRGSDAHNQDLSERRAASVRAAFDQMGVTSARFRIRGHGEQDPVATNSTTAGMRLNRRVEVTLLGRRSSEFNG